jgi:phosphatidate cytidylyltransferase
MQMQPDEPHTGAPKSGSAAAKPSGAANSDTVKSAPEKYASAKSSSMMDLGPRLLSALAMGVVAFGLLYAGPIPFTCLVLVAAVLMSWEWGMVVRQAGIDAVLIVHATVVAAAATLAGFGYAALALIALIAGTLVVVALRFGEKARLSAVGVLYTGMPAVALIELRTGGEPYGFLSVLFVLIAVIATDTMAYFAGRGVGGPKLWPAVSPNKTWSGLIGGIAAAAIAGAVFARWQGEASIVRLAFFALVLGLVAQGGDLAESSLKRTHGIKDASALLPGHGGLMDRMDGVVAAAIAALLIGLAINAHNPARALLLGY